MSWRAVAGRLDEVYGIFIDWEERFFICPDCDEPIYEDDWTPSDLHSCPVCGFEWDL